MTFFNITVCVVFSVVPRLVAGLFPRLHLIMRVTFPRGRAEAEIGPGRPWGEHRLDFRFFFRAHGGQTMQPRTPSINCGTIFIERAKIMFFFEICGVAAH